MTTTTFGSEWEKISSSLMQPAYDALLASMPKFDFGGAIGSTAFGSVITDTLSPVLDELNKSLSRPLLRVQQKISENLGTPIATTIAGEFRCSALSNFAVGKIEILKAVSTTLSAHQAPFRLPRITSPGHHTYQSALEHREPSPQCRLILSRLHPAVGKAYLGIFPSLDVCADDYAALACFSMRRVIESSCRAFLKDAYVNDVNEYVKALKRRDPRAAMNKYGPNTYARLHYIKAVSNETGLTDMVIDEIMRYYEDLCVLHELEIDLTLTELHAHVDTLERIVRTVFVTWEPSLRVTRSC